MLDMPSALSLGLLLPYGNEKIQGCSARQVERALLPEFSTWNGAGQKRHLLFILVHFSSNKHLIEHLLGDRSCPEGYNLMMKRGQPNTLKAHFSVGLVDSIK